MNISVIRRRYIGLPSNCLVCLFKYFTFTTFHSGSGKGKSLSVISASTQCRLTQYTQLPTRYCLDQQQILVLDTVPNQSCVLRLYFHYHLQYKCLTWLLILNVVMYSEHKQRVTMQDYVVPSCHVSALLKALQTFSDTPSHM